MRFLIVTVIAILQICSGASACELSLVAPARSALKKPVQAAALLNDGTLTAHFSVATLVLNATKDLGPKQYPYDFDVVELFVTFSETGYPYFEFEVSPYNQTLQVRIVKPGLIRSRVCQRHSITSTVTVTPLCNVVPPSTCEATI